VPTSTCFIVLVVLVLGGCDAGAERAPVLERVTPSYGPLAGGTRIVLEGRGFLGDGVAGNRVVIGGREAPLVAALDDALLEVVIPPGQRAGAAEILVFNQHGTAIAADLFHYSTPPVIEGVTPSRVVFDAQATMTITGRGFRDEGAGDVTVLVDGTPAETVTVVDDTTLTFTAPVGRALATADLEVIDARGSAREPRGYRYVPSTRPGLLLFTPTSATFAIFHDPVAGVAVPIARVASAGAFSSVITARDGELWGADRAGRYGRIDLTRQVLIDPVALSRRIPAMVRAGDDHFAIDRATRRVGRLDPAAGTFTPIGDVTLACCGSYGIAFDGTELYVTARADTGITLTRVDPATGVFGAPVTLAGAPGLHVEDLRFFAGTLYATSRNGTLVTIDPATGATTVVATLGRATAIEIYE